MALQFSHLIRESDFFQKSREFARLLLANVQFEDFFKRPLTVGCCNSVGMHLQGSIVAILMLGH